MAIKIHDFSWTSFRIGLYFDDTHLAYGTAFLYEHDSKTWLITAGHNFTGKHPQTGKYISDHGGIPNRILAFTATKKAGTEPGTSAVSWTNIEVPLYTGANNTARWIWHKSSPGIDVAAIRVNKLKFKHHIPVNSNQLNLYNFRVYAGHDAFIIGYPNGWTAGGGLPIWKHATVASEPGFGAYKGGWIYVDTSTREGMSGSAAFAKVTGPVNTIEYEDKPNHEPIHNDTLLGTAYKFIGVYTSRPMADDKATLAQLGQVYLPELIEDLLNNPIKGPNFL